MSDTIATIHPFEAAGLGHAPFRFVAVEHRVGPINLGGGHFVGAPGQPMGTCDYCGTGIADCCIIRSADGKQFIVGSTCVAKVESKGSRLLTETQRAVREMKKVAQAEKDTARIVKTRALLTSDAVRAALVARPHINAHMAGKGLTLLDWAEWMLVNAGTSGRLDVCRVVEKVG